MQIIKLWWCQTRMILLLVLMVAFHQLLQNTLLHHQTPTYLMFQLHLTTNEQWIVAPARDREKQFKLLVPNSPEDKCLCWGFGVCGAVWKVITGFHIIFSSKCVLEQKLRCAIWKRLWLIILISFCGWLSQGFLPSLEVKINEICILQWCLIGTNDLQFWFVLCKLASGCLYR